METARSVNSVPIRLTAERWTLIVENHDEMAGRMDDVLDTVARPDWITRGNYGSLLAWKGRGRNRYLSVIYRETGKADGFVITAFMTSKPRRTPKIWP